MERKIENTIDHALENLAPLLYFSSILIGIVLVLLGFLLYYFKGSKIKLRTVRLICIGIGFIAIFNGIIQLK
ncbi:hypothetical protein V7148_03360 [Gottfriedia acidiceleris]|uniref:hypothetical protein n=1 Tax=Gottfriedia acidiceleris TaxID=371036 RepID=UPI002FFDA5CB